LQRDKKLNRRKVIYMAAAAALIVFGCGGREEPLVLGGMHNGDAKFYKDSIVTSVDSVLTIVDKRGNIRKCPKVCANWIDTIEEKNLLVYGNGRKEIGIVHFDEKEDVLSDETVFKSENLMIDPTISENEGDYYLTYTEIKGMVNNADPNKKNGEYTLHLYRSNDLKKWEHISDIARDNNNIEDVDIVFDKGKIMAVYEKEVIDKGKSAVVIKSSFDKGQTWGDEKVLLDPDADQEPAVFEKADNGWRLYYSSDIAASGETYMGASAYYASFDPEFRLKEKDKPIRTRTGKGILLYDVRKRKGKTHLLYAHNYLTDCDLMEEGSD